MKTVSTSAQPLIPSK